MITGFDWDGTLVESWTATPLPGVRERLTQLPIGDTFIATNQAGPVVRAMLNDPKYPAVEDVAQRIVGGLRALDWHPDLLLIAVHPGKDGDDWLRAAEDVQVELRDALIRANIGPSYWAVYSQPRYRKPGRGMLDDAIAFFRPDHVCYIGDMDSDRLAAERAGVAFQWAAEWLAQGLR